MRKFNVSKLIKQTTSAVSKHSPEILTGFGIAGMITTTVLAVKATPKAMRLIEAKKKEDWVDELPVKEVVKATWKCYIPAAVTGSLSIACLIGASSVHLKRNAALATAYKLSETALTEYREQVIETIGEKKEQAIKEKVNQKRIDKDPVGNHEVIITGRGNTLCYDYMSGRYFNSDIETIKKAVNELNRRMIVDMYVSLNDFYDELDLEHIAIGYDLGWNIDKGLIDPEFSANISEDGQPCIVLGYRVAPQRDFSKFL